ncbi:hypothetical protein Tsp_08495 [Trichinella spiralis]|uniref:hypothetical protein n=1 Tax=Trichinella spiralis TaxID=6334 RepID=UPI0001EFB965|nr:hypothetical protein Tsp_08495 [Trichinella spiralis]
MESTTEGAVQHWMVIETFDFNGMKVFIRMVEYDRIRELSISEMGKYFILVRVSRPQFPNASIIGDYDAKILCGPKDSQAEVLAKQFAEIWPKSSEKLFMLFLGVRDLSPPFVNALMAFLKNKVVTV